VRAPRRGALGSPRPTADTSRPLVAFFKADVASKHPSLVEQSPTLRSYGCCFDLGGQVGVTFGKTSALAATAQPQHSSAPLKIKLATVNLLTHPATPTHVAIGCSAKGLRRDGCR
jgi:hypothetical protein